MARSRVTAVAAGATDGRWAWEEWLRIAGIALLLLLLVWVATNAIGYVGYLVGWITGASESPISYVVIPLIFGLLSAVGIRKGLSWDFTKPATLLVALVVAYGVWLFCSECDRGIKNGIYSREQPYTDMVDLIGKSWRTTDLAVVEDLYRFRWWAQHAGVASYEFDLFVKDVIRPILRDSRSDKPERVRAAITNIQSALPALPADYRANSR